MMMPKSTYKYKCYVMVTAGLAMLVLLQGCGGSSSTTSAGGDQDPEEPPPIYDGNCPPGHVINPEDGDKCISCAAFEHNVEQTGFYQHSPDFRECVSCFSLDIHAPIWNPDAVNEDSEHLGACESCPEHAGVFMYGAGIGNRCVNATYAEITDRVLESERYARHSQAASVAKFVHMDSRVDEVNLRLDQMYEWFLDFKKYVLAKLQYIYDELDDIRRVLAEHWAAIQDLQRRVAFLEQNAALLEDFDCKNTPNWVTDVYWHKGIQTRKSRVRDNATCKGERWN